MDLTEQLRVLDAAQGDPAKLALATIDLAYPELEEAERATLKETLEAAAIPHWCDGPILTALLDISPEESTNRLARLEKLTVLEPFRARGDTAIDVHEATRLALRKALAAETPDRFRALSRRMVEFFASDFMPRGRIEWIYHLLCEDSDRGATELEKLHREWSRSAITEDLYALSSALEELRKTRLVQGRGSVWAVLVIAWIRVGRGEAAQLEKDATVAVELAHATGDKLAVAESQCLMGDVLQAQGKLAESGAAFAEYQKLIGKLAEQDSDNDDRQADLGVAHNRVGGVLEAQGKLPEAQEAFAKSLAISQSLSDKDPSNAGRRRDLGAAQSRVGAVLQAQGKLTEALDVYGKYLEISQQLVDLKPNNASWKQLLAGAYACVGEVLQAQRKLTEAQDAFEKYLSMARQLVEIEPTNANWQLELAAAHSRIGDVLLDQNKLPEAQDAYEKYLAISQQLVSLDASDSAYQKHLAAAHSRIGELMRSQDKLPEAQVAFAASLAISQLLVKQDSTNVGWQVLVASAHNQLGQVFEAQKMLTEARGEFEQSLSISQQLVNLDPTNIPWQRELVLSCMKVARMDRNAERYKDAVPLYERASTILAAWTGDEWTKLKETIDLELALCKLLSTTSKNEG